MNSEINLAIRRHRENRFVSATRIKKFRLIATVFLFSVAILSTGLFFIIASSSIPSLRKQEESTSKKLERLQPEFGRYLLVKSQLKDVKDLLSTRPDLRGTIDIVHDMIPSGVVVSNVALDGKTISMAVSTTSLDSLEKLFSKILDKVATGLVPKTVTTTPISYSAVTNQYNLQISFK